jgi:thiol-disulfide isomerase/thioredoxin
MVLLQSKSLNKPFSCPDFSLPTIDNNTFSVKSVTEPLLLVAFICNHCPYVKAIFDRFNNLAKNKKKDGLFTLAICSNDVNNYPEDSKENLLKNWQENKCAFVYALDEDQSIAKAFDAVCTPEFFLFNNKRELFYHGRFDDNWQDETKVSAHELEDAINALLKGERTPKVEKPSLGCSIKWKREGDR